MQSQPLSEDDLQLLCKLGGLMLMRRTDEPISHEEALQEAHGLALKWLQRSNEPVPSVEGASSKSPACLELCAVASRSTLVWPKHSTEPAGCDPCKCKIYMGVAAKHSSCLRADNGMAAVLV